MKDERIKEITFITKRLDNKQSMVSLNKRPLIKLLSIKNAIRLLFDKFLSVDLEISNYLNRVLTRS